MVLTHDVKLPTHEELTVEEVPLGYRYAAIYTHYDLINLFCM